MRLLALARPPALERPVVLGWQLVLVLPPALVLPLALALVLERPAFGRRPQALALAWARLALVLPTGVPLWEPLASSRRV